MKGVLAAYASSPVLRFVLAAAPATVASLVLAAGIVIGFVPVGIASKNPIDIRVESGTAATLVMESGATLSVGGSTSTEAGQYGATLTVTDARLRGLCLIPRFDLPFVDEALAVRLRSSAEVRLDDVTLGASAADAAGIKLPKTDLGLGSGGDDVPTPDSAEFRELAENLGLTPTELATLLSGGSGDAGGLQMTSKEEISMRDLNSYVYRLRLGAGIRLTSLQVAVGFDDLTCAS